MYMYVFVTFAPAEDTMKMLRLSLTEFSLPKFYQLFGISKVKSAAVSAFRSKYTASDRSFAPSYSAPAAEHERMSLHSLEVVTDALLEIMEVSTPPAIARSRRATQRRPPSTSACRCTASRSSPTRSSRSWR